MNVLELNAIDKRFGGVHALRGASFSATAGEIHAICGENGAGKSTLLKILSGVHPRESYEGSVRVRGEEQNFRSTRDAERAGIAIVHQELMLVPELSVAQNLMLGRELGPAGIVDDDAMEAEAIRLLSRFGVHGVDPTTPVGTLGIGVQQVVEIVRALSRWGSAPNPALADANEFASSPKGGRASRWGSAPNPARADADARILILDEPTAALTVEESQRLMTWLRELRAGGTTCLYVSHRMDEVFALADRVTVLRDGKTVATVEVAKSSTDEVVSLMVGRSLAGSQGRRATPRENDAKVPALEARELSVLPAAIQRVSFSVGRGEVLAFAGAMGSGRTALLSALFGAARLGVVGSILLDGAEVTIGSPCDAVANGLALVPEDRKGRGLVLGMTVAENLTLPPERTLSRRLFEWIGLVDEDEEEMLAARRIGELKIRGAASAEVATLSGGNQQKVVLGKWLESPPRVLLLDEPTRGVDIGAREEIYELIEQLTRRGAAVIVASSDLAEVLRLAHRVIVLRQGRIAGELEGSKTTEEEIVALSTGAVTHDVEEAETAESPLTKRPSTPNLRLGFAP